MLWHDDPAAPVAAAATREPTSSEAAAIVLYDAALDRTERRPLAAMPDDDATAGAVALSIKTLLRLPPAPSSGAERAVGWRWIPSVRLGWRAGFDGDVARQLRALVGLELAPPRLAGVRLGVLGDVGSSTGVDGGGFKGDCSWQTEHRTLLEAIP